MFFLSGCEIVLFVRIRWIFFVTCNNPARSFVLLYFRDHFTIECQTLNFVKIVSVLIFAQWLVKKVGVDGSWLFSFSPASGSLLVLNFHSHQLLMNFGSPLIGCCDCQVLYLIMRAVFNGVSKVTLHFALSAVSKTSAIVSTNQMQN